MCNNFVVGRKYELKRRAERQQETRRRIVEAAIELHRTKGPGRTSLSDVARLAGVQRNTLYRHFPEERDLLMACSGLYRELNPPPDPEPWRSIPDPARRLRRGLTDLYGYYEQVEDMLTRVLRDAEFHHGTREIFAMRSGPWREAVHGALAEGLPRRARTNAILGLAVDFRVWQRLVRGDGLSTAAAVETMVASILAQ
jgi:AcrR family transcriptional regulator